MTRKFKYSIVALWSPILCNQPVDWEIEDRKSIFFKISSADDVKMSQLSALNVFTICSWKRRCFVLIRCLTPTSSISVVDQLKWPIARGNLSFLATFYDLGKFAGKSKISRDSFLWSTKYCAALKLMELYDRFRTLIFANTQYRDFEVIVIGINYFLFIFK